MRIRQAGVRARKGGWRASCALTASHPLLRQGDYRLYEPKSYSSSGTASPEPCPKA